MSLGAKYILVGYGGQIRIFDPQTNTFSSAKTSGTAETLNYVSGDSKGEVIFAAGDNGAFIKSVDGGETWQSISGISGDAKALKCVSRNEVFVAAGSNPGKIYLYNGNTVSEIYSSHPDSIQIKCLFGAHNQAYVGIDYGTPSWGVAYYPGSGSVTPDTSINYGNETDVFAGTMITSSEAIIATWNPSIGKIAVYAGSNGTWSLVYSTDVGVSYRYYNLGKYADYNRTLKQSYIKIDDPLNGRYYLISRNSAGVFSLLGPSGIDDAWGGIAVLDGATNVAAAKGGGSVVIYNGSTFATHAVGAGFTGRFSDVWTPHESAIEGNEVVTPKQEGGTYCRQITGGDIVLDDRGDIYRDYSIESRCTFRLMCRRGEYWADPTLGSRLHTIKTLKDAKKKVDAFVREALKPLISEGSITNVAIGEYYQNEDTGSLAVQILIEVPSSTQPVDLGLIPIGGR